MGGYQKVTIMGRLGKDPEVSYTAGGMAICKFSMATSRKKKGGEEITSWHRCTAFNKSGELIGQYVQKGQELLIDGELSYGQYEKDGQTVYTTNIIVNQFSFISGSKSQNQGQNQSQGGYQQQNQQQGYQNNQQNQGFQNGNGGQQGGGEDDTIPF